MLKPAQLYIPELKKKFWEIAFEDRYMFVNDGWVEDYEPVKQTWGDHEFVSVNKEGEVLGYIRYRINQRSQIVSSFCAINFTTNLGFARDLFQAIDDIFVRYQYKKLKFGVYVGNPVEKTYDKLCERYGGRIVGVYKEDAKLMDGKYYDYKTYELFRDDYMKHRRKGGVTHAKSKI